MGGKPSKGTPADRRLKANKTGASNKSAGQPKFGSKAWDAKYGIKPNSARGKKK